MNKHVKISKFIKFGIISGLIIAALVYLPMLGPFAILWMFSPRDIDKELSIQQAGEKLTIHYTTTYAREHSTTVFIFANGQSDLITEYLADGDYIPPKIKKIYDSGSLEAFEWTAGKIYFITYKTKSANSHLKAFSQEQIESSNFEDADLLYPVAKQQFNVGKWNSVLLFSELLLKCNDTEAKATLQRYARGLFTDEEMMQNRGSPITSSDVQEYAAKLISKYP